jgi:hypothetical protein
MRSPTKLMIYDVSQVYGAFDTSIDNEVAFRGIQLLVKVDSKVVLLLYSFTGCPLNTEAIDLIIAQNKI